MTAPDHCGSVAWALSQIVVAANIGDQDGNGNPTRYPSTTTSSFATPSASTELLREMSVSPIMGTYPRW